MSLRSPSASLHYSAITPAWLRALFIAAHQADSDASAMSPTPNDPRAFALVGLLHAHDAVHRAVDAVAVARVLRHTELAREFPKVSGLASAPLTNIASRACAVPMRVRTGGMRLAGTNPFVASFAPPAARDLASLLQTLDMLATGAWRAAAPRDAHAQHRVAYAEYFALLAIHPLPDGNGRTARAVYASRLWHAGLCDARLLLAIPMSFSGRGNRFHLATQLARAGAFDDLFANWRDALMATDRLFAAPLASLHAAVARFDIAATVRALESLRQTLIVAMA